MIHEGQVRQVFLGFTPPRIGYLLLRIPLGFPRKFLRPGRRGGGTAARAPTWQGRNVYLEIHEGYGVFLDHETFAVLLCHLHTETLISCLIVEVVESLE